MSLRLWRAAWAGEARAAPMPWLGAVRHRTDAARQRVPPRRGRGGDVAWDVRRAPPGEAARRRGRGEAARPAREGAREKHARGDASGRPRARGVRAPQWPVELTAAPETVSSARLAALVSEAVASFVRDPATVRRVDAWLPSRVVQRAVCEVALAPCDEDDGEDALPRAVLAAWARACERGATTTWPSEASLRSGYLRQKEAALQRACVQSLLGWLQQRLGDVSAAQTPAPARGVAEAVEAARTHLLLVRGALDLSVPALQYPAARTLTRQVHLHVGPTNSGKTHGALVALSRARTGVYAGPLRLLAHEVWDRLNHGEVAPSVPPRACNLRTGEELREVDPYAGLTACTVEMVDVSRTYDVAVIDEIQMVADPQRGFAWTHAVLGLAARELHLCGEASAVPLVRRLAALCGDELHVHEYERLTPLAVAAHSLGGDLSRVERGDCVVAFSRAGIFKAKEQIEARTGLQCAVAYGALPPETKAEQAKLFNAGKLDVMVASDAIGMGLNLKIQRVIFDALSKWDGQRRVPLSLSQIKQIAGRAGRYGTSRTGAAASGEVLTRHEDEMPLLRAALAAPVRPLTHASLQPTARQLEALALVQRGRARGVAALLDEVRACAQLDVQTFALSEFDTQKGMAPILARARGLTHHEQERWSHTPVNFRDERAVAWVAAAVERYARGELVRFEACAAGLGTLEAEAAVDDARRAAEAARPPADAAAPLALYATAGEDVLGIAALMLLESLHRTLTLYLWLGFRFPLAFCFRHEVEALKTRTEGSIEFCLEAIRVRRAQRLARLGRASEAPAWAQASVDPL